MRRSSGRTPAGSGRCSTNWCTSSPADRIAPDSGVELVGGRAVPMHRRLQLHRDRPAQPCRRARRRARRADGRHRAPAAGRRAGASPGSAPRASRAAAACARRTSANSCTVPTAISSANAAAWSASTRPAESVAVALDHRHQPGVAARMLSTWARQACSSIVSRSVIERSPYSGGVGHRMPTNLIGIHRWLPYPGDVSARRRGRAHLFTLPRPGQRDVGAPGRRRGRRAGRRVPRRAPVVGAGAVGVRLPRPGGAPVHGSARSVSLVTQVVTPRLHREHRFVPGPPKRFAQAIGLPSAARRSSPSCVGGDARRRRADRRPARRRLARGVLGCASAASCSSG